MPKPEVKTESYRDNLLASLQNPDAVKFTHIGYSEVLAKNLRVMDASAVAMCRDNRLRIMVFNLNVYGNIMRMAMGEPIGTLIS